jgi:hypothetical protein
MYSHPYSTNNHGCYLRRNATMFCSGFAKGKLVKEVNDIHITIIRKCSGNGILFYLCSIEVRR